MATGLQNQKGLEEKLLRRQLAATIRDIQWSYAIFWSLSTEQQGVLTWTDGYYNGDIKTRKTTQPMEFKADQIGLQRSEQLRELYESLSSGDSIQQPKRPSVSLSPEDLSDTEWYYLVCMSFSFSPGQGLPGKALAKNQHIWLNNAQFADSKIFSRSLLAKSASIQTVVGFPFMDGVLELGTTELVLEDPSLIHYVTTSFWELPFPVCSEQSIPSPRMEEKDEDIMQDIDHDVLNTIIVESHLVAEVQAPLEGNSLDFPYQSCTPNKITGPVQDKIEELHANIIDDLQMVSADDSSNEYCTNQHTDDVHRMDGLNGTSQVQSRQIMDDGFSNGLHNSLNSSDCISLCFSNPSRILSCPNIERIKNHIHDCPQEGHAEKLISLDIGSDDSHYTRTLTAILRNSKQLVALPSFPKLSNKSSFTVWRRALNTPIPTTSMSQRLLKKISVDTAWMHGGGPLKLQGENDLKCRIWKSEGEETSGNHVLSERRRREKLNEKFLVLRSLVPSISKVDKASILADTIEYLKELERRVEELESCRELVELEARDRRKYSDVAERTSDNYGNNEISNGRKPATTNKRKACSIDEAENEDHWNSSKDGAVDVSVTMLEKEVLVELCCPWRECLLLEVVDAISSLHLDAHSLQSSITDGILALMLKAKFRGSVVSSPGMVKRALQRVVGRC